MKTFFTSNRVKSFLWRTGMMVLAAIIASVTDSLTSFGLTPQAVVVLGLILGEVSKAINSAIAEKPGA
jgi:hypothetical protein